MDLLIRIVFDDGKTSFWDKKNSCKMFDKYFDIIWRINVGIALYNTKILVSNMGEVIAKDTIKIMIFSTMICLLSM